MRVGIVGGVERQEPDLHRIAERAGHEVEFHSGHVRGRGQETLASLVERCDLVVIVTDVNSHGAVRGARDLARRRGRTAVVTRKFGPSRLSMLFAQGVSALS
ncbi:MAG: DUF2325 domain-containing protein [Polyangiales bacterium]